MSGAPLRRYNPPMLSPGRYDEREAAEPDCPDRGSGPGGGNFFQDLVLRVKLILRLMGDRRVSPLLKLLPLGSIAYVFVPDLLPGPIDDAAMTWFLAYLFVSLRLKRSSRSICGGSHRSWKANGARSMRARGPETRDPDREHPFDRMQSAPQTGALLFRGPTLGDRLRRWGRRLLAEARAPDIVRRPTGEFPVSVRRALVRGEKRRVWVDRGN